MTVLAVRNPWTPRERSSDVTIVPFAAPASEPLTVAEVMAHLRLDASAGEPAPTAITAALASPATPGNVNAGAHRYLATFVTSDGGETQAGLVSSAVTVANAAVNGQVSLTAIPLGGSTVVSRKIYRTVAGGSLYLYLATIADNSTEIYTDNIADASLGAQAPTTNTTLSASLGSLIQTARVHLENELSKFLITQTVDFKMDAFGSGAAWPSFVGGPSWVGLGLDSSASIVLPKGPLQSVTSITYIDADGTTQTWSSALYSVDAANGRIGPVSGQVYPSIGNLPNAVVIRAVVGYGAASAVPPPIKAAMKLYIEYLWEPIGVASSGKASADALLAAIDSLIRPYRMAS